MARQKRRRKPTQESARATAPRVSRWQRGRWLAIPLLLVTVTIVLWALSKEGGEGDVTKAPKESGIPTLSELLAMSPSELADVDIALMNLRCAEGLKGSEGLDIGGALKALDEFANHVQDQTEQNFYRFSKAPSEFENSEPYFRLMMMTIVLQEDGKVQYNPTRISAPGNFEPNTKFFADSKDVFVNGLTGPPMTGTCSSLPVLYVAIGRRLGYPLRLVSTKSHLFVRWEDKRTRMNVEATGQGFKSDRDDYYKTWPYTVTDEEIAENGYLKSMTPQEELACFMALRGHCFYDGMGHYLPGLAAHREAARLAPHIPAYRVIAKMSAEMLQARQTEQIQWLLDKADNPDAAPPPSGLFRRPVNR